MHSILQPKIWPPPKWSPKDYSRRWWFRIPVLGFITSHTLNHLDYRRFLYGEVSAFEDDISKKLADRSPQTQELTCIRRAELLSILAEIVKDERDLKHTPTIYMDDKISILCYGVDNLTLLRFTIAVNDKHKKKVSYSGVETISQDDNATVRDLIDFVQMAVCSDQ